jgi:hypothetical protein
MVVDYSGGPPPGPNPPGRGRSRRALRLALPVYLRLTTPITRLPRNRCGASPREVCGVAVSQVCPLAATRHKRGNPLSGSSMALHPPSAGRVPRQAPLPTGRDKVSGRPILAGRPEPSLGWAHRFVPQIRFFRVFSLIRVNNVHGGCLTCRKDGWAFAAARVALALGAATAPTVCHESRNSHPSAGDSVG